MSKMVKVMAVLAVVMTLTLGQVAMAAPTNGQAQAAAHSQSPTLLERLADSFGAIWGAIWTTQGAIWCGRGGC